MRKNDASHVTLHIKIKLSVFYNPLLNYYTLMCLGAVDWLKLGLWIELISASVKFHVSKHSKFVCRVSVGRLGF